MEVDRKRSYEGPIPSSKRPNINAEGPVTADEIELFQKEAIFRQMNAYKRESHELHAQLLATEKGDEALREQLANLTQKYVAAAKQVERLTSPTLARLMKSDAPDENGSDIQENAVGLQNGSESGSHTPNGNQESDAKALLESKSNLAAAEGEIKKLKEFMDAEDKRRGTLEQQVRQLEEKLSQAPSAANHLELRLKEARAETQKLVLETQTLQDQISTLKEGQAEYELHAREQSAATIASLERRAASAEADVARIRGARDELLSEVNVLKAESAEHRNESNRLKELLELHDEEAQQRTASAKTAEPSNTDAEVVDIPESVEALRERCLSLIRQNKALTEEISGLEQGFARASSRAKAALKATSIAEQKLGVLNTAKVRSDEKFIGAMRGRDALNQDIARVKQALAKSAEVVRDQKALEQKLIGQITRLQKQVAQGELSIREHQIEADNARRARQEADGLLASARSIQDKLREQLAQCDEERTAAFMAKRNAETTVEKVSRQLETQRAVSGLGSATEVQEQLESLRSIAMCPVCQKNWKDRAITTCGHTMCYDCIQSRIASRMRKCPMCNGHFASTDILTIHL